MLQNLLPGLREIRAPLASGYVWGIGLWLLLSRQFKGKDLTGTVSGQLVQLANWAGKPATLVAISFAAYLTGVLSTALTARVMALARWVLRGPLRRLLPGYRNVKRADLQLRYAVRNRLSKKFLLDEDFQNRLVRHAQTIRDNLQKSEKPKVFELDDIRTSAIEDDLVRLELIDTLVDIDTYTRQSKPDVDLLRYRLVGKEDQIYAEIDRNWAEADFRLGLAIPSLLLWAALAVRDSPWWLFGILASIALAYVGAGAFSKGQEILYATVASGRIELDAIDSLPGDQVRLITPKIEAAD